MYNSLKFIIYNLSQMYMLAMFIHAVIIDVIRFEENIYFIFYFLFGYQ